MRSKKKSRVVFKKTKWWFSRFKPLEAISSKDSRQLVCNKNIKLNEFFIWIEAVEVVEATEVPNTKEVNQYVKCMLVCFYFQRPKRLLRSSRSVMLSCVLSLRPLKFSEPHRFLKSLIYWLESPYLDVLKKKWLFEYTPGILVKFCPPSELRLWRTGMLLLTKSKGYTSNSH